MLTDDKLPPLPEPEFLLKWIDGSEYKVTKPNVGDTDVFTTTQMHEYARAVERAAYEAAIKAVEEFGRGVIYTAHDAGVRAAAKQAHVAVIRSLTQEQPT